MSWKIDDETAEALGLEVTHNADGSTSYHNPANDNAYSRNTDLAGQTVYDDDSGMNVSYDANGYAVAGVNPGHALFEGTDRGVRAQSKDAALNMLNGNYDPYDLDTQVMTNRNLRSLAQIRADVASGKISVEEGNREAEMLRALYGYAGGANGATYSKIPLTTFNPDDPTTQPGSKYYAANPNTDWTVWRQNSVAGPGYTGPVSGLRPDGSFSVSPFAAGSGDYVTAYTENTNVHSGMTPSPAGVTPVQTTGQTPAQTPGTYGNRPEYASQYMDLINQLAQDLVNRGAFSYDVMNDPLYQQYTQMYTRNGQNAMQDILGQLSARTGGMANSWAGTMAQQGYNNYMQQLNDTIPQLYQQAYSRYQDDESRMRRNFDMMLALEDQDYKKYLQELGQWNTDRGFNYNAFRDAVGDTRYMDEQTYRQWRDAMADMQWGAEHQQKADAAAAAAGQYEPTFKWTDISKRITNKDGSWDLSRLDGNMLNDFYYYMYGDPYYGQSGDAPTGGMETGTGTGASGGGSGGGSGTGSGSSGSGTTRQSNGVDNGGLTREQVEAAQRGWNELNPDKQITVDGSWGPNSQKVTGKKNARDAYYEFVSGSSNNPNGYTPMGVLNAETNGSGVSTGGSSTAFNQLVSDIKNLLMNGEPDDKINNIISAAMSSGMISSADAVTLRKRFIGAR